MWVLTSNPYTHRSICQEPILQDTTPQSDLLTKGYCFGMPVEQQACRYMQGVGEKGDFGPWCIGASVEMLGMTVAAGTAPAHMMVAAGMAPAHGSQLRL